jgi:hypothetical protein
MRTYSELEPSDIDLKNDPVHSFIFGQLLVVAMAGFKPPVGKKVEDLTTEESNEILRKPVADFLNALQKSGYYITSGAPIPAAFKKAFE